MKLIDSHFEVLTQGPSFNDGLRFIESIGRTCYKSEDKLTEDSYRGFVQRMIKSEHYAMLEFFTVYLKITSLDPDYKTIVRFYENNRFSRINIVFSHDVVVSYITTNYRVILENNRDRDMVYMCIPEFHHFKRYTVKLYCSRSVQNRG